MISQIFNPHVLVFEGRAFPQKIILPRDMLHELRTKGRIRWIERSARILERIYLAIFISRERDSTAGHLLLIWWACHPQTTLDEHITFHPLENTLFFVDVCDSLLLGDDQRGYAWQ